MQPVTARGVGSVVAVRVVPGASAAKVVGLHGHELRLFVALPAAVVEARLSPWIGPERVSDR